MLPRRLFNFNTFDSILLTTEPQTQTLALESVEQSPHVFCRWRCGHGEYSTLPAVACYAYMHELFVFNEYVQ